MTVSCRIEPIKATPWCPESTMKAPCRLEPTTMAPRLYYQSLNEVAMESSWSRYGAAIIRHGVTMATSWRLHGGDIESAMEAPWRLELTLAASWRHHGTLSPSYRHHGDTMGNEAYYGGAMGHHGDTMVFRVRHGGVVESAM